MGRHAPSRVYFCRLFRLVKYFESERFRFSISTRAFLDQFPRNAVDAVNEKAYENALVIELKKYGHTIEQQRRFDVFYEGILVDNLVPDLLVDGLVVVDPKVVTEFNDTHVAQMMGYLAITGYKLAILLNFKHADLRHKRVVR